MAEVAFDSSNNLYVADCSNNCVQVFTVEGQFVRAFSNNGALQKPFAIAMMCRNHFGKHFGSCTKAFLLVPRLSHH